MGACKSILRAVGISRLNDFSQHFVGVLPKRRGRALHTSRRCRELDRNAKHMALAGDRVADVDHQLACQRVPVGQRLVMRENRPCGNARGFKRLQSVLRVLLAETFADQSCQFHMVCDSRSVRRKSVVFEEVQCVDKRTELLPQCLRRDSDHNPAIRSLEDLIGCHGSMGWSETSLPLAGGENTGQLRRRRARGRIRTARHRPPVLGRIFRGRSARPLCRARGRIRHQASLYLF